MKKAESNQSVLSKSLNNILEIIQVPGNVIENRRQRKMIDQLLKVAEIREKTRKRQDVG